MATKEEWVEVLVPQHLVPDVYGLIAERMAKGAGGASTAGVDEALVQRMFVESPPAMRDVLLLLADNAGKELTTSEVAKAIEHSPAQLAGVLGAFGRRRKNRYNGAVKPFTARWDHGEHTWTYRMAADVAEVIKRSAKDAG